MRKIKVFMSVFVMLVLFSAYGYDDAHADASPDDVPPDTAPAVVLPPVPAYTASAVVVMCADTGMVLYGSDYHTQMYPASITKVMTALVVLDHVQDMRERVHFSHHSVFSIPRNSSHISMDVGETLSVNQALHALMLRSANEVAIALAEHVAGSEEEFVRLMNLRAQSLGAYNTHFTNVTGLPGAGHVTTAYDMALIMRETVRDPLFVSIIGIPQFAIAPTERQRDPRYMNTTNEMIRRGPYFDDRVMGAKTGWTHAAGNTLVTYAVHEGRRIIVTLLQAERSATFRETTRFLNFAFALPFEERVVFIAQTYTPIVPVFATINGERAEIYRLTLQADRDLTASVPAHFDLSWLSLNLTVQQNIVAPVAAGDVLGSLSVYAQNSLLGTVSLMAQSNVLAPQAMANAGGNASSNAGGASSNAASASSETASSSPGSSYSQNSPMPDTLGYAVGYSPYYAPPGQLFSFFQNLENLQAFAVPLAIMFASLLAAVLVLALRRRKKLRYTYRGQGVLYHYRQ
jgi:D-alanyl-D-alanine carboxypeptidase